MTTMVSRRRRVSRPHPVSSHRHNPLLAYERRFANFLRQQGVMYLLESDEFPISPRPGQTEPQRPRPDFKVFRRDGSFIYIELTHADLFKSEEELPLEIRERNLRLGRSGKPHISPAEYLRLKCERMAEASITHGVVIEVLTHAEQVKMMDDPPLFWHLLDRDSACPSSLAHSTG